jgi:hypothetical protein
MDFYTDEKPRAVRHRVERSAARFIDQLLYANNNSNVRPELENLSHFSAHVEEISSLADHLWITTQFNMTHQSAASKKSF